MAKMTSIDWDAVDRAADAAGFPYFTRRKWRQRENVPAEHWPLLISESKGELTADGFVASFETPVPSEQKESV